MAKSSKVKPASRRDEVRRNLARQPLGVRALLQRPEVLAAGLLLLAFIVVSSAIVAWARDQIFVAAGQVMTDTHVSRLNFTLPDETLTQERRRKERERSPEVYALESDYLNSLRSPLTNLPMLVAQQPDFQSIDASIREAYALDEPSLAKLAIYVDENGDATETWRRWVDRLIDEVLPRHPLLDMGSDDWQRRTLAPEPPQLRDPRDRIIGDYWRDAITLGGEGEDASEKLRQDLAKVVAEAGFRADVKGYVVAGLAANARPTYVLDTVATAALADARVAAVAEAEIPYGEGDAVYKRGEVLTAKQLAVLKAEAAAWRAAAPAAALWLPRLGILGLVSVLMALAGGFVMRTHPRVIRNKLRVVAIGALLTGMLAVAAVISAEVPPLLYPAAIASTLFVALVILLAYDQRLALFLSAVQCALVTLAVGQGVGWLVLLLIGCGTMIGQLREVRHRSSLIRAATITATTVGVATLLLGLLETPQVEGVWMQLLSRAAWAVAASIVVGFLVLGILPSIERMFDITTGMTLAELRDPSQPLLRQLQQRAPGTYNHSIQVANIAEAAAEAVGADSLLVYVGALYHDIGKMNKPEYFIENQAGGFNKHSRLRPAMSLLVIIGHVKDGIELAREYGLPRSIQHFIESHHGTTLVEYFYHAAKTEAESDAKSSVDEVEFRYPGPRPRAKEAAVLMLADSVESAARTMTEPNPSRIENLVRELSRKRLVDGQFDECDLTFRELGLIEDAMIARLCAIHHGRISYPTAKPEEPAEAPPASAG